MKKWNVLILGLAMTAILATSAYAVPPTFYFDLEIDGVATELSGGSWLYEYTVSAVARRSTDIHYELKDLSHWWLELPEEKLSTLSNFVLGGPEVGTFNEPVGPYAGRITGVKWDSSQLIKYSFESTHAPVFLEGTDTPDPDAYLWFAKSGNSGDFWDEGRTVGPNGVHGGDEEPVVPEPATALLFGGSLAGLLIRRFRG